MGRVADALRLAPSAAVRGGVDGRSAGPQDVGGGDAALAATCNDW